MQVALLVVALLMCIMSFAQITARRMEVYNRFLFGGMSIAFLILAIYIGGM